MGTDGGDARLRSLRATFWARFCSGTDRPAVDPGAIPIMVCLAMCLVTAMVRKVHNMGARKMVAK